MSKLMSLLFIILSFVSTAEAFDMGVNIHGGGGGLSENQQFADIMRARNLKTARLDFWAGMNLANFRDQVLKIRANGGRAEVTMQVSFQWDNSCNQNFSFIEQDAYNQTATLVNQIKDIVHDIELLNETQLRPEILREVPFNSAGTSTAPYVGKPCIATLTAALRGMSRAIRDIRASSGVPLRTILGVVGRDFGFLTYMEQNGVLFDVTGYHIYPWFNNTSLMSDPWFGVGGPLVQLAKFNRPVHINEFNCGEIYDAAYNNAAGSTSTETCLRSLDKHLTDLKNQTIINLETVHIYELLDEPSKAPPENNFGLMYSLTSPKVQLFLISAFAGGSLTSSEQMAITSRGLLTDAEIAAYRGSVTPTPTPAPSYTLSISSPASGATVAGTVQVVGSGLGFLNVEIMSSSGVLLGRGTPSSTGAFAISINTTQLSNGTQALAIYAWDSPAGQAFTHSAQTSLSVNVQNLAPTPTPTPTPSDTVDPIVSITSPANNSVFARSSTVSVSATATDNVGVTQVQFYSNGALICTDLAAPYQCSVRLQRKRRTYTIEAVAWDAAGRDGRHSIVITGQ